MSDDVTTDTTRRPLQRLSHGRAIGWPLILSSFVVFLIDGFPVLGGGELDGTNIDRVGVIIRAATLAQIPIVLVLFAARFTWLRPRFARRHPSITVITFFVAALIGDIIFQGSIAAGSDGRYRGDTVIDTVLYKTAALAILGVLIADLHDFRARIRNLDEARRTLTAARARAHLAEIDERAAIDTVIGGALRRADSAIHDLEPADAAVELQAISSAIVRPVSHDLASTPVDFTVPEIEPIRSPTWNTTLRDVTRSPLIAPRVMAAVMVLLGFRQSVTELPDAPGNTTDGTINVSFDGRLFIESISVLTVIILATWGAAHLVRRGLATRLSSQPPTRQALANLVGVVAIGVAVLVIVGASFALPWFPDPPELRWWTPLVTIVPLLFTSVVHGLARSLTERRAAITEQLRVAIDDLRHEVATINEHLWFHRRRLAHLVHGPVQAELNSAAIRLTSAARLPDDSPERAATIAEVRQLLAARATDLTEPRVDVAVADQLTEIVGLWTGVCAVGLVIDPAVVARLDAHPAAASTVVAIVGEACANAVHHGRAAHITVESTLIDDRTLRLRVSDDGQGDGVDGEFGLGMTYLDDVALEWDLDHDTTGTVLTVDLPVS